jgi:formate-dependent nitrite reductase membrane component NrfD
VTSSVSITHFNHLVKTGHSVPAAFTEGSQWAFWVTVGVAIVGLIATLVLVRPADLSTVEGAPVTA